MDNSDQYKPNIGEESTDQKKEGSAVIYVDNIITNWSKTANLKPSDLGKVTITPERQFYLRDLDAKDGYLDQFGNTRKRNVNIETPYSFGNIDNPGEMHEREGGKIIHPKEEAEAVSRARSNTPTSWISDPYAARFRYGLSTVNLKKHLEDPTYLGFVIDIDKENSPLLSTSPDLNNVRNFLLKYSELGYEGMRQRLNVLREFTDIILSFFSIPDNIGNIDDDYRPYYITSIGGLEKLNDRFAKSYNPYSDKIDASFIEVSMNEDVTMLAQYIAKLHNDLKWSYGTGRAMVPANLLKFNMAIKISEVRNMASVSLDFVNKSRQLQSDSDNGVEPNVFARLGDELLFQLEKNIKSNTSSLIYYLYDCEFDFSQSNSFDSTLDIGEPKLSSGIKFKIYYKGVRRVMRPTLWVADATYNFGGLPLDDARQDLNLTANDSFDPDTGELRTDGELFDDNGFFIYDSFKGEGVKLRTQFDGEPYRRTIDPLLPIQPLPPRPLDGGIDSPFPKKIREQPNAQAFVTVDPNVTRAELANKAKKELAGNRRLPSVRDIVNNAVNNVANLAISRLQEAYLKARAELVNRALYNVRERLGIKRIVPSNVYKPSTTLGNILDEFKSQVGFGLQGLATDKLFELENNTINNAFNTARGKFRIK